MVTPIQGNRFKSETILVASGDQALLASGNLAASSGNALNIADGQLGLVSLSNGYTRDYGAMIQAGDTITAAPIIKVVQGTPNSTNIANVGPTMITDKSVVESAPLNSAYSMSFQASLATVAQYNSWVIGHVDGNTGALPEYSNTDYQLNITFDGVKQNRYYGLSGMNSLNPSVTTPDFTVLNATYTDPRDYIVQNLAYEVNKNSKLFPVTSGQRGGNEPIVAFAINTAGGSGQTLTGVAGLAIGATIDVVTISGQTHTITVDQAFKATVASWIAAASNDVDGSSTIELIDLSAAGTASGVGADVLIVMAVDDDSAFLVDTVIDSKVKLRVGMTINGTYPSLVTINESALPVLGNGDGKSWQEQYDRRAGMQVYNQQRWGDNRGLIVPPEYIDPTKTYVSYIILHWDEILVAGGHAQALPHKLVILLEANAATGAISDTTTSASLDSVFKPWLDSCTLASGTAVDFTP